MVDIHIRDISDPNKRNQLINELVREIGSSEELLFELKPGGKQHHVHIIGRWAGWPCRVDVVGSDYEHLESPGQDAIAIQGHILRTARRGYGGKEEYPRDLDFRGESGGSYRTFIVPTIRLVNIRKAPALEPVVVKKEIGA